MILNINIIIRIVILNDNNNIIILNIVISFVILNVSSRNHGLPHIFHKISYLRWFQIKAKTLPSSSSPYDVRAQVRLTISRAGVLVTG